MTHFFNDVMHVRLLVHNPSDVFILGQEDEFA